MAIKIADAFINITGRTKDLERDLDKAERHVTSFIDEVRSSMIQEFGASLFHGIVSAAQNVVGFIGTTIESASNLNETMTKTMAVFGDSSAAIIEWSKTTATSMGLSQNAALTAMSSLGNMFVQLGAGTDEASKLSKGLVELAGDLASFHNVAGGAEEVLVAMQAGLRGEYDSLQRYIPTINAAAVEQQALADTGKEAAKSLTVLDKALATQKVIVQGAGVAMGDFANTIGGVANQQRILSQQLENAKAAIGSAFTPIYTVILEGLNSLIEQILPYGEGMIQALAQGMVDGIVYLLPVVRIVRDFFTEWFRPSSPPKVLPDIDKWGKETLEVYLKGMTQADFGILRGLGDAIEGVMRSFVGTGELAETEVVQRVFGTQASIAQAIAEWKRAGQVSAQTMENIRRAAGPAGDSIGELVSAYFDLETASKKAAQAQEELTRVTARYDNILSPLNSKLDDLQDRQNKIRDNKRLTELGEIIADPYAEAEDKQAARLEAEEIRLQQQIDAVEEERDVAVDAEQQKVDAAKKEEDAKRDIFEREQAEADQMVKNNSLITEEIKLRERLASEALAAQEKALRELEAAQRKAEAAEKAAAAEAKAHAAELERTYQAMLSYNMATADTPGKIALMRLELGRYKEGSAEYYGVLEQIFNLEEQLKKEREKAAGAGAGAGLLPNILPPVGELKIPSWVTELTDHLKSEIDKQLGIGEDEGRKPSILDATPLMSRIMGPAEQKLPGVSQDIKDFVAALKGLTGALDEVSPALNTFAEVFGTTEESTTKAQTEIDKNTATWLDNLTFNIKFWAAANKGDWETAWTEYKEFAKKTQDDSAQNMVVHLGEMLGSLRTWWGETKPVMQGALTTIDTWLTNNGTAFKTWQTSVNTTLTTWATNTGTTIASWITTTSTAFGTWTATTSSNIGTWLSDTYKTISEFDLAEAGSALLGSLHSGMKKYWDETIVPFFQNGAQWIADILPGSEPKDPSSPLRGLSDRGEALMENLSKGMETGAQKLQTQFSTSLQGIPGAASLGGSTSTATVNLNFYGNVTPDTIRHGVATADDELKRRGYK